MEYKLFKPDEDLDANTFANYKRLVNMFVNEVSQYNKYEKQQMKDSVIDEDTMIARGSAVIVAYDNKQPVGYVTFFGAEYPYRDVCSIIHTYVIPTRRREGILTYMLYLVEDACKELYPEANKMELDIDLYNTLSKQAHVSSGFKPIYTVYRRDFLEK